MTNLQEHPMGYWEKLGCRATFVHMKGMEGITGMYAVEIPQGGETKIERNLYEEVVYIMGGEGRTQIYGPGEASNQFDWQEGSFFAIPLNSQHKLVNTGDTPVFYTVATTAPLVFDLFHNEEFLLNSKFNFTDRYSGEPNYFSADPGAHNRVWNINFVKDARIALDKLREARSPNDKPSLHGYGYDLVQLEPCGNSLIAHLADWPTGRYAKAHHHGGGAILHILRSEGYSLMWPNELGTQPFANGKGDQVVKVDWKVGSVFSPPTGWFHQHFNVGREPALQLALRNGSRIYPFGVRKAATREGVMTSVKDGGTQIEYEDEDPEIRRMFIKATASRGVTVDMPR